MVEKRNFTLSQRILYQWQDIGEMLAQHNSFCKRKQTELARISSPPEEPLYIRVVHGSDGPAGRVGSGRVTILPDFGGSGRVGSGQHFGFFSF